MKAYYILISLVFWVASIISCTKNTQQISQTTLAGTVKNELQNKVIFPAFIFLDEELIATTDINGNYNITSLEAGEYRIIISAVGYEDNTISIIIADGKITTTNFSLVSSDAIGRVYGEFHDANLYDQQLIENPSLSEWNELELWEGVSGATIQKKTMPEIGDRTVTLGDSLVAYSDGFGQYWFKIQCGTYQIKGICDGYKDKEQTIVVKPDDRIYVNFILENK
ncbi:MAG: carboxypeptidase-like regulatory domain-containing protein [Salinivirgaceae bacterium]|jgi:hypothetical protein|nr:carboxypeptidase-like regulatory domain-containing protein [Salinivirgaceae bacterium]